MKLNSTNISRKHSFILNNDKVSVSEDSKVNKIEKPQTGKILTSLRYPNIFYFDESDSEHTSTIVESERSIESEEDKPLSQSYILNVSNKNDCGSYIQLLEDTSDIMPRRRLNEDFDYSAHPSYDIFKCHYKWLCSLRYQAAKKECEKQFQKEIAEIINIQPTALDQYFTEKLFFYTTIWPPMHTQSELEIFKKKFFQLSRKQRERLNYLMETKLL